MFRRDIIDDDLLTDRVVKLSLSALSTCGFAGLKLHINMARRLTCPLVNLIVICPQLAIQYMAPKNNFAVKTGRLSFPAAQTKIRRRLRVFLN